MKRMPGQIRQARWPRLGAISVAAGLLLLVCDLYTNFAVSKPVPSESFVIVALGLSTVLLRAGGTALQQRAGLACAATTGGWVLIALLLRAANGAIPAIFKGPVQYHAIVWLLSCGLLLCDFHTRKGLWVGQAFTLLAACAIILGFMGYGIGHFYPFFGESPQNIIPLWTLCCFALLALASFQARPRRSFVRLARSNSAAGLAIRRLIPVPFVFPFVLGMLNNYANAHHWYSAVLGGWLFSFGNIVGYCVVVWWSAELVYRSGRASARIKSVLADTNVKLQTMNDELELRVQDRTRELTEANEYLKAQAEALERTNAELEQFAYVASHDLQEPLRNVRIYSQLVSQRLGSKVDADGKRFLDVISDGAARMAELVSDLLAYSKTVHQESEFQEVDLNRVVKRAAENCSSAVEQVGAVIEAGPLPVVRANEMQMIQVFQNLLSNSLKYCVEAPPVVFIKSQENGCDYVISFRDNGIGIAPEYHERIFALFKRLHKNQFPGTGVGLTLCRRIIQQHGGRIWLESEAGAGSTFFISLPAMGAAKEASKSVAV